uniref:OCEL domain-containing protein n=1 Tax=Kalanchoe fedtschenkoi TaxID=63787 RepID=A0A7N0TW60_KALFE
MYGGPSKLGRGGGGGGRSGGNSRMSFPPPSAARPPGRLGPVGGPRNRLNSVNSSKPGPVAVEEHFSLVPGSNPLAFAMIIRLTPDLVEEIRKVEAQGGHARIKFDANANNTSGNVIDVGGKDFRFTWSREMGGLCDIYEERESGEGRDGILVESSCAWRKVNVQRVLDDSTTSHVKMRSVEAELKHKSRQAIVLDHSNPAAKNQLKALAAAESNPFRNYKQKKEPPFKKRKVDSSPGGGPSKPLSQKPVLSSPASAKFSRSASPLLSTPNRVGGSVSPYGTSKVSKRYASAEDPRHTQVLNKEDKLSSEKDFTGKAVYGMHANKGKGSANPVDMRSKIVSLLTENPKGMTIKALEIAVGDAFSNVSKEIGLIVESIAIFQPASGRYILKQLTESESSKDPSPGIGGLPEHSPNQKSHVVRNAHQQSPAQKASFADKLYSEENREQEQSRLNTQEDITAVEKNVIAQDSNVSSHRRSPNKSDDRAGSSSNSGSDSDSDTDSSDSGSDSESKSKSPAGSGSSSDSDSDASINSKEGSDEDVDIMSEDDEEQKVKHVTTGQGLSSVPSPWRTQDGGPQNRAYDNDEYYGPGSTHVVVEKIFPDEDEDIEIDVVADAVPNNENDKSKILHRDEHHKQENHGDTSCNDTCSVGKEHEKISSTEWVSKGKSKSGSEASNIDEKSDRSKRSKPGNLPPHPKSRGKNALVSEASGHFSPPGVDSDLYMNSPSHLIKRSDWNDGNEIGRRNEFSEGQSGQLFSTSQPPGTMPVSQKGLENMSNNANKAKERDHMGRGSRTSESRSQVNRGFPTQNQKSYGDTQNEDVAIGNKYNMSSEFQCKEPEAVRQDNGAQQSSKITLRPSPKDDDRYPFINGQRKVLHRELSDLEMGELREPVSEEPLGVSTKHERERSLKKVDSEQGMSDDQNKEPLEQGKVTSPTTYNGAPEVLLKKRTTDKTKRPQQRANNSQIQRHLTVDPAVIDKKNLAIKAKQYENRRQGSQANANKSADLVDGDNDALLPEQKRRESSSDENSCSYTKYEKNEPDLRGPIKDFSQYKEYVQEYNSKYDSYCSLNKILESYRSDFLRLGKDLENAKGKDKEKYNNALSRLRDTYRQSGAGHKRLKKIFLVLHEELKQLKERIKDFAVAYSKD